MYSSARQDSKISSSSVNDALDLGAGEDLVSGCSVAATTSTGLVSAVGADDTEELDIATDNTGSSRTSVTGVAVGIKGADGSVLATGA